MTVDNNEFQEVGHCGGKFAVTVKTTGDGRRSVQFGVQHSSPKPASLFAIYALPQGIPVGTIQLGGIGDPWNPPPIDGCIPVFIGSDSRGMFGHQCPTCKGYWRSKGAPSRWRMTCAYCGIRAEGHSFLTEGQMRYVSTFCDLTYEAMTADRDGESVIDMDSVADSAGKEGEKPKFYYAEESQQNRFACLACNDKNDILGRYGYCSCCGTHNGLQELERDIERIRERIKTDKDHEGSVKDTVAAFDSFVRQIAKQLARRIPMTPARRQFWDKRLFHNLKPCAEDLKSVFDIDPLKQLKQEEVDFAVRMFHRRHIYEHNGGEVDEKYIRDSGDTSVRVKQVIRETADSASQIADAVLKIARNIHEGFHQIFPPEEMPIKYEQERIKRRSK